MDLHINTTSNQKTNKSERALNKSEYQKQPNPSIMYKFMNIFPVKHKLSHATESAQGQTE